MKPAPFEYIRAASVEQAVETLAVYGEDARVLAGGQSLIAMLNLRLAQPKVLIDISRTTELDRAGLTSDGHFTAAAATTQNAFQRFADLVETAQVPLLAMVHAHIGHVQTRNKGTVCGSIAHADPSSELPLCLVMLGGEVELVSKSGPRRVPGAEFFIGPLQTVRKSIELITRVSFPVAQPGDGYAFNEMALRHGDFALVAVAVKATAGGLRIGIGGAADKPQVRDWPILDGSALDDALNALAWDLEFQEDAHASAKTRRHLVRTLGRRTVIEAVGRGGNV